MTMTRAMLAQLEHVIRPLRRQLADVAARAFLLLVDDSKKMQLVQVGVPETVDGAEHFQPYGLSSVPLAGAEGVAIFPNGDRSHPLVVTMSDRRYRPTGGDPGQVTLHQHTGAKVIMMANGDIEVQPAPGHEVLIRDASGAVDRLVKRTEFLAHGHATAATGAPSAPMSVTPLADVGQFPGTQRVRAQ